MVYLRTPVRSPYLPGITRRQSNQQGLGLNRLVHEEVHPYMLEPLPVLALINPLCWCSWSHHLRTLLEENISSSDLCT